MTDQARKYLSDIKKAIDLVEAFILGIDDFEQYQADLKTKSAVERQLGIIGEAANQYRKIETEFQLASIKQIVIFRNRIIHSYDNVDDSIVWTILKNHLPLLKNEVHAGLK